MGGGFPVIYKMLRWASEHLQFSNVYTAEYFIRVVLGKSLWHKGIFNIFSL